WISYDMAFSSDIAERASAFEKYLCKYFGIHSNELKYLFCGFNQDTISSAISYLYASKIITPQNNANAKVVSDANPQKNALILVLTNELEWTIFQQRYDECKHVDSYLNMKSSTNKKINSNLQQNTEEMILSPCHKHFFQFFEILR
ncbi:hypothetical protein RFI_37155, partial [Reticulomyxa filosa]